MDLRNTRFLNLKEHCAVKGWPYFAIQEAEPLALLEREPPEFHLSLAYRAQSFICYIENAQVIGDGLLFLEDGIAVDGLSTGCYPQHIKIKLAPYLDSCNYFPSPLPRDGELEEAVLCWGTTNFGHWIFTYLHRLTLLWNRPELLDKPLLVKAGTPPRFIEWLAAMGFKNIVYGHDWVKVRRLWVPSVVQYRDLEMKSHFSPEAVYSFRYLMLKSRLLPTAKRTRFFVSRARAKWRRILNEAELIEALAKFEVETVYMEDMTLDEQLDLVSQSELIVMTAGASSPITMLAPINCKIVELTIPIFAAVFGSRSWARIIGQQFHRIDGVPVNNKRDAKINADFTIDVDEVVKVCGQATYES